MILSLSHAGQNREFDLSRPIEISISIKRDHRSVEAFYIPHAEMEPFRAGDFIGSVASGGYLNCENILFNAHGNGTHTECVGHVSKEHHFLGDSLKSYFFPLTLLSIEPQRLENGDALIEPDQIPNTLDTPALAIRTLPNKSEKIQRKYSGKNPIYLRPETAIKIRELGVEHLLIDLPSVDKEEDGGALASHKAFWNYPDKIRSHATITEFIYVPDSVQDGLYLLNLMASAFETDAVPSRPILYPLK